MFSYARFFALVYDPFLAWGERAGMREVRRRALAGARGRVLEVGAGTGLNLALYPPTVQSLTLADPEAPVLARLRRRAQRLGRAPDVVQAPAEALPFPDHGFDTVVCTLVLCTVRDLPASLRELRRVLAPGGQLLFVEHVRASEPGLARWQDRLHEPWRRFAYGCHCNRDTAAALRAEGFEVSDVRHERWPRMPAIVGPTITGTATVGAGGRGS
jgi:ubiquinone/menaquinone biosynthesis C-methylase UbiE